MNDMVEEMKDKHDNRLNKNKESKKYLDQRLIEKGKVFMKRIDTQEEIKEKIKKEMNHDIKIKTEKRRLRELDNIRSKEHNKRMELNRKYQLISKERLHEENIKVMKFQE